VPLCVLREWRSGPVRAILDKRKALDSIIIAYSDSRLPISKGPRAEERDVRECPFVRVPAKLETDLPLFADAANMDTGRTRGGGKEKEKERYAWPNLGGGERGCLCFCLGFYMVLAVFPVQHRKAARRLLYEQHPRIAVADFDDQRSACFSPR